MNENNRGYNLLGSPLGDVRLPDFIVSQKWAGADLQTMRHTILGPSRTLADAGERLYFEIEGGQKIVGALHRCSAEGEALTKPLVILVHGLASSEEAASMVSSAAALIEAGFPVLRLSLRGAGPSAETSIGPTHAGLTKDFVAVLEQLPAQYSMQGVFVMGLSLGGNMMLKYLGLTGKNSLIRAAVAVSTPLDLKAAERKIMESRNSSYHGYILQELKRQVKLSKHHHPEAVVKAALAAATLYEFDDVYVSRVHGFDGADKYYASQSAGHFLIGVRVPTLMIHAENDPWIPVEDYRHRIWPEDMTMSVLLTQDGGHLGFHTQDHPSPWHNRVAAVFFEQYCD
tara:strand:- start:1699 stop:2724 length:1026 start_codon:yes stop_codon:yes gene_type:complete